MNREEPLYDPDTRIAITGVALRLPGGENLNSFWEQLISGRSALCRYDHDVLIRAGYTPEDLDNPDFIPVHGMISNIDCFDATLFDYSPREAELLDPQQRLLLQLAWESLEHAGIDAGRSNERFGVFTGTGSNQYAHTRMLPYPERMRSMDHHTYLLGNEKDFCASRIAYKLNLKGPAITIQSACSTGLVAVHNAVQHLLGGECDAALAGACSLQVPQEKGYHYQEGGILSGTGECLPFDRRANGTVGGSGGVMLVLKRLDDAIRDHHTVYGIIAGSAVNNDGSEKAGFTAPSVGGQVSVIRDALHVAGVSPEEIGYVEAHGTGTEVGDPIELTALQQVYGETSQRETPCYIGAVKAVTGHLDTASGLVGLVKAMLALRSGKIPGNFYFEQPSDHFNLDQSGLAINRDTLPWSPTDSLKRAGVSSLGLGGTNAHLILEEPPGVAKRKLDASLPYILPISADSPRALSALQEPLEQALRDQAESVADIAFTLQEGRRELIWRSALVVNGEEESSWKKSFKTDRNLESETQNIFLFPGQGAQYKGMGSALYAINRTFREEADRLCLYADTLTDGRCTAFFKEGHVYESVAFSQCCMYLLQLTLARFWRRAGVTPDLVMGHSLGEYTAATMAGVLQPEEALNLIVKRGILMDRLAPGTMVTVLADWETISELASPELSLAARNAPGITTVSGPESPMEVFVDELDRSSITFIRLEGNRAFHSAMLDEIRDDYFRYLTAVEWKKPAMPWLSTSTGEMVTESGPEYWIQQMREPVYFQKACSSLSQTKPCRFLEVGPGSQLTGLIRRNKVCTDRQRLISSLDGSRGEMTSFYDAISSIWVQGGEIRWDSVQPEQDTRRIALPAYPFDRTSYWLSEPAEDPAVPSTGSLLFETGWEREQRLPDGPGSPKLRPLLVVGNPDLSSEIRSLPGDFELASFSDATVAVDSFLKNHLKEPVHILCFLSSESDFTTLYRLNRLLSHLSGKPDPSRFMLSVVGREGFEVTGSEELHPCSSAASALLRNAGFETPELRLLYLDLGHEAGIQTLSSLLQMAEPGSSAGGFREFICRGRYLWRRTFNPVDTSHRQWEEENPTLKKTGELCLISGGTGDLGIHLAEWLQKRTDSEIILLSRRAEEELADQAREKLRELRSAGAKIHVIQADLLQPVQLRLASRTIRARFGEVQHLFHLAGKASNTSYHDISQEDFEEVMSVKNTGLENLLAAFESPELSALTLYSSIAPYSGGLGGVAYAASSAWMDTMALRLSGRYDLRIWNWCGWSEIGMAEKLAELRKMPEAQKTVLAKNALSPSEGRMILDRVAEMSQHQLVISKSHPAPGGQQGRMPGIRKPHLPANGQNKIHTHPGRYERPDLNTPYEQPENEIQHKLASIWQDALGLQTVGLDDNFFDLGADSLMMIKVREKIAGALDAELTKTDLFEFTTIRKLAAFITDTPAETSGREALNRAKKQQQALAGQFRPVRLSASNKKTDPDN